jgi:8-oxo-dGTP diphosphatase
MLLPARGGQMKKEYNLIVVFDETGERVLMCRRKANPYKGLYNFVGGKIEPGEDGLQAAYRELREETSISGNDIRLTRFIDFTYHLSDIRVEVYVGQLNKSMAVYGDENQLVWLDADQEYFDMTKFAGEGNIGHIMEQIRLSKDKLLK